MIFPHIPFRVVLALVIANSGSFVEGGEKKRHVEASHVTHLANFALILNLDNQKKKTKRRS